MGDNTDLATPSALVPPNYQPSEPASQSNPYSPQLLPAISPQVLRPGGQVTTTAPSELAQPYAQSNIIASRYGPRPLPVPSVRLAPNVAQQVPNTNSPLQLPVSPTALGTQVAAQPGPRPLPVPSTRLVDPPQLVKASPLASGNAQRQDAYPSTQYFQPPPTSPQESQIPQAISSPQPTYPQITSPQTPVVAQPPNAPAPLPRAQQPEEIPALPLQAQGYPAISGQLARPSVPFPNTFQQSNALPPMGLSPNAPQAASGPINSAMAGQELAVAAEHLEAVAEHLEAVADKLAGARAPLPFTPPAPAPFAAQFPAQVAPIPMPATPATAAPAKAATSAAFAIPSLIALMVGLGVILMQALTAHEKNIIWMSLLGMNVVGTVGFNLMLRRSAWQQVDQWVTATVLQTGLFLPFLAKEIFRPIHFPTYTPFELMLLAIGVICLIALQFCNVKALQILEASVYSVIFNTRIMFATAFAAFFLSEAIGLWSLLGGLLIFVAIFIIRQKGNRTFAMKGVLYSLGAAFAMSLMNTCEKELITLVGYQQYVFPMWMIAAVAMWGYVFARGLPVPYRLLIRPQGLVIMGLRAFAGIGFTAALMYGSVAVSSYVSSLSVVLMVVFGLLFYNERDYLLSKIISTATALLGLTFILFESL